MAESMIERVARAIEDEGPVGCCVIEPEKAGDLARAAIKAVLAGIKDLRGNPPHPYFWPDNSIPALDKLDAALNEQVSG